MITKKPLKLDARAKRAIAKLAVRGMRFPESLTYGQIRRIARAALDYVSVKKR